MKFSSMRFFNALICGLITLLLAAVSHTARAEQGFENIIGAALFCTNTKNYIVDWGGNWSAWNVTGCTIPKEKGAIVISMVNIESGREGRILLAPKGITSFSGEYKNQGNGFSPYFTGAVYLEFSDNGRAVGNWRANEGLFGGGSGSLEIRPKNSQRMINDAPNEMVNALAGLITTTAQFDKSMRDALGEKGMEDLKKLNSLFAGLRSPQDEWDRFDSCSRNIGGSSNPFADLSCNRPQGLRP